MSTLIEKAGSARFFIALLVASLVALAVYLEPGGSGTPVAAGPSGAAGADATLPTLADAASSKAGAIALARQLSEHLEKHPEDARSWTILARLEFEKDRFADAARAYERALALPSKVATDPAVWCEYADAIGMTQGGKLTGKPRQLIDRALALNPKHPKALEMAGSAEYAKGDYSAALLYWRPLLATLEPRSPAHAELTTAIARADRLALMSVPARGQ